MALRDERSGGARLIGWAAMTFAACYTVALVVRMPEKGLAGMHPLFRDKGRWVLRSYALTFAAVSLRAQLGIGRLAGWDFDSIYPWIAWISWLPQLLLVELWLWRRSR